MEELLSAINRSLQNGNFYSALFLAITMPSICAALESSDGNDTPGKYVDWYDRYMPNTFLTGLDCYGFRCGLLHSGTASFRKDPKQPVRRVIFVFHPSINNNSINEAVQFNGITFCQSIVNGVQKWLIDVKDDKNFIENSKSLISLYPNGLSPYVMGIPVVG